MSELAQHSSATNEHYTPPEIVEAARALMGKIDLDPASCPLANECVRAECVYSENGLSLPWGFPDMPTRVLCNPPGGKLHATTFEPIKAGPGLSSAAVWYRTLCHEHAIGNVDQAIFVCFSLNIFQNGQEIGSTPAPYAWPFCVPRDRLKFWNAETDIGKGAPTQPNAILYLPPKDPYRRAMLIAEFERLFSPFGAVRT